MARIELSHDLYAEMVKWILNVGGTSNNTSLGGTPSTDFLRQHCSLLSPYSTTTYYRYSTIFILNVAQMPSTQTFPSPNSQSDLNSSQSWELVSFLSQESYPSNTFVSYNNLSDVTQPITINTAYKAAQLTGTAQSFIIVSGFWATAPSFTPVNFITGTVGVTGSGADLEISDVNIVSGTDYRIVDLKLKFPQYWDY